VLSLSHGLGGGWKLRKGRKMGEKSRGRSKGRGKKELSTHEKFSKVGAYGCA